MIMEFNIQRNVFLSGIQKTLGIVEKKTTMPILNNILIRTDKGKIRIVATDREISLLARYDAHVIKEGEITLSARKLYEMVREMDGEAIHFLKNDNNMVTMTCKRVLYKIPGIPADDYPRVADEEDVKLFTIKAAILRELIHRTLFAVSTDEMRKNLTGVFLETPRDGDTCMLQMVATDGHRLAIARAAAEGNEYLELDKGVIIPRKGLGEIKKIVDDETGVIALGVHKGACIVRAGNVVLKVSMIDAEYPEFRKIIPAERDVFAVLDRNVMLHALRRMNVIASEGYSGVIITLSEGKMVLSSTNPDVGEANEEIDVSYADREINMGYNVNYLISAIEVIEDDKIVFEISGGMKPGVIKPANNEGYMCIIMPLKI